MVQAWRLLILALVCAQALECTDQSCLVGNIEDEDIGLSLLQKGAKEVVASKLDSKELEGQKTEVTATEKISEKSAAKLKQGVAEQKEASNHTQEQVKEAAQVQEAAKVQEEIEDKAAAAPAAAGPEAPAQAAQNANEDGGIAVSTPTKRNITEYMNKWGWGLPFNNISLILISVFLIVYEVCVNFGLRLDGLFDQETAGKWQYYSYGFYQYAVFGVCVPLSEPLSTALGYNPAWSGLLMTIMPAMEVPGIEIGRRLVMPFNQDFLCKWLVFGRLWMCASQAMWVIVLLTPSVLINPSLCFWLLMLSRALLGLGSGAVNTPTTYMAVKWTSKERMKNMTSYATMAKRLGMSFGVLTSSFVLEIFNMTAQDSTVYQMAALPVAFCMFFGLVLIVLFDISCCREQPPEDSDDLKTVSKELKEAPKQTIVVQTTEASLARRASIVLNSIIYNFSGSMQRESIDLSSTMIFAFYGIDVITIGYLIAAINFSPVAWIAIFTEFMKKGTWLDPAHLLVYYSYLCTISGIFFFNWGPWWTFFTADCVCFCMTTAAIGISNGIATNAGIPDTHFSKDSFTAYRAQTTAGARFLSGPVARGSVYFFGRNGYAVQFLFWLAISQYNNWRTRHCFLEKDADSGYSEEDAQANGVKRGGK